MTGNVRKSSVYFRGACVLQAILKQKSTSSAVFRVYIASSKHSEGSENSRQLCKFSQPSECLDENI